MCKYFQIYRVVIMIAYSTSLIPVCETRIDFTWWGRPVGEIIGRKYASVSTLN